MGRRPLILNKIIIIIIDNCPVREKESIEKIQNEAARLVTCITRSASINNLYREIDWMTLEDRRKYQKIVCIYKIIHGLTPNYLRDIFAQNVSDRTSYTVRNANDIDIVHCRTELLASSFISSSISLWNELPDDIKSLQSISLFKSRILKRFSVPFVHGIILQDLENYLYYILGSETTAVT